MKHLKKLMVCLIFSILLLSLTGCSALMEKFDNPEIRQATEKMLDCLIADDSDSAYILIQDYCTREDFDAVFPQMRDCLGQSDNYDLKLLSIYSNTYNMNGQPITVTSATYALIANDNKCVVCVQKRDIDQGLQTFQIVPYERTDYYYTGTIQTMKDANVLQWIALLSNFIIIGLTVFAIVDCCRHNIKKKVLWILLITLGFVTIGATVGSTNFYLNFNLGWLTSYSALIRYGSGTIVARLMLPVGFIIYLLRRRALLQSNEPVAPENNEDSQCVDQT